MAGAGGPRTGVFFWEFLCLVAAMSPRFLLLAALLTVRAFADDYTRSIEDWRAARVARLTTPDGWLTLVGRHLLAPGTNTVGTAPDNSIKLASGPPYLATVTLAADRKITLQPNPSALLEVDGVPTHHPAELVVESEKPTKVTFGTASFYVMRRGEGLYLRVRNSEAAGRAHFAGLDYFPIDPAWRIEAAWMPFNPVRQVNITNMIGVTEPAPVPGRAVFTYQGHTVELLPIDEGGDDLFFVLTDLTAGEDTYEASRFLYAPKPKAGETKVVLDFNRMQNPPCAFTAFATCPLPPKENRLPFRVTAGEKKYRGNH
jgi:uncharacterized protein (DUF1684 family)